MSFTILNPGGVISWMILQLSASPNLSHSGMAYTTRAFQVSASDGHPPFHTNDLNFFHYSERHHLCLQRLRLHAFTNITLKRMHI